MTTRLFIGLAASVLLAACAVTGVSGGGPTAALPLWKDFSDHPKGYLGDRAPRAQDFVGPPPVAGAAAAAADLSIYRATRALQGSPRWTQAAQDAEADTPAAPAKAFGCALGAELDIGRQPMLMRLLARVMGDADAAVKGPKEHYRRPRPFLVDDGAVCVAKEDWLIGQGSYPSGHAATGWAWALILAEMAPDRQEAILKRGLDYGDSRVVCGVHYASDVAAGRAAGAAVVSRLRAEPLFLSDLAVARRELETARASGPRPPVDRCRAEAEALSARPF